MLPVACNNEQKVKITAAPRTAGTPTNPAGNPAQLDGPVQAEVVSGDGTVETIPTEPNSFYVVSGPGVGKTTYRVFADADLGTGVVLLEDTIELEVSGAQAASFGLTAGAPEPK
jgi:hypothetical protein